MELLELELNVAGRPLMDQIAREQLLAGGVLERLEHSLRAKLPRLVSAHGSLTAQVEQTAVFITDDWVVSIYGKRLLQCVSAMLVLSNEIQNRLGETIDIRLRGLQQDEGDSLVQAVKAERRNGIILGSIKWAGTILISALAGAIVQWLFCQGVVP